MNKGDPLLWPLLLQAALIAVNAFFACAEIALISLNENKLEKMSSSGNRKAQRLLSLTREPAKFLATIQVGITLAGFLGSAFAADNFSGRITSRLIALGLNIPEKTLSALSLVTITLILSFFTLVLGELLPKRVAMKKADALAFAFSGIILFTAKLFAPLVWLLSKATNALLRLLAISPEADSDTVTEEEIRLLIDMGSARGIIKDRKKEILHNVFEFDNKTAGEVMTHRRDAALLRLDDGDDEWEKTIVENRHSFFPVCGKSPDDIAGVLKSRDYLCLKDRRRETVMARAVHPAQFIPNTVRTDALFARMKKNRNHFAVVIDEHGGMMGVVTMKDLLEELFGNLGDDSSVPPEKPLVEKTGSGAWIVNGAVSLDKAARALDAALPVERYETFAGFVFSLLGRIPEDGSRAELEACGLNIKILEVKEHRLEKALVTKPAGATGADTPAAKAGDQI